MRILDSDDLVDRAISAAETEESREELGDFFYGENPREMTLEEFREMRRKMVSMLLPIAECANEESVQAFEDEASQLARLFAKTIYEFRGIFRKNKSFHENCWRITDSYNTAKKCHFSILDEDRSGSEYLYCFCDEREALNEG